MSTKRISTNRPVRSPPASRPKNRILAALSTADFHRLRPHLETIPIPVRRVLHTRGHRMDAVYFLNGGVASITTTLSDGTTMEAATIGDEGVLGIEAFLGADAVAPGENFIQVPDTSAERLSVHHFRRELARRGAARCTT